MSQKRKLHLTKTSEDTGLDHVRVPPAEKMETEAVGPRRHAQKRGVPGPRKRAVRREQP